MKRPWVSNAATSARASFSRDLAKRGAAGGEAFDQPLVDGLAFAVLLAAIGGGHVRVAVDQARQMDRHQPPRVLRVGIERLDALERLLERRQQRR